MSEYRVQYRVQFTVEARAAYDDLPPSRQAQLDRAVRILARDPFRKHSTAQLGPEEHLRKAYVAPGVMLEYMVAGAIMVVVVLEIFDESAYLIDEADAR
ncbi:type II toxin-antitoxin system RelE/ParE family toxin [Streptomyces sp. NPDC053367]|uniref:type II toxin-antitoxin system RelE/ParE family toxin n=1 Tax=Streptomyces sp. NPDC053367 TaxID=3365700 RepID=UPI0037D76252